MDREVLPQDEFATQRTGAPEFERGEANEQRNGLEGDPALDGTSSAMGGGTEGRGPTGGGRAIGGRPGDGGDRLADGGRVSASRGRGSRNESVHHDTSDRRSSVGGVGDRGGSTTASRLRRDDPRDARADGTVSESADFRIEDSLGVGEGGLRKKFAQNIEAIRLIKRLSIEKRAATTNEQAFLARYVGWGGLQAAFPRADGTYSKGWERLGRELRGALSAEEYEAASASTRNAHFTPTAVVRAVWEGVERLGFTGGIAHEPSVGIGNFLGLVPERLRDSTNFVAVELDGLTSAMTKALYPGAIIHAQTGYQDFDVPNGGFADLVIGNPPFGQERLYDPAYRDLSSFSIHNYFFAKSLDTLRPGGVLAMVVSRYLLDARDSTAREYMAERARLIGAIRLPNTAFQANANTDVVTDIIFLQKRSDSDPRNGPEIEWTRTREVPDPLGGDPIPINAYFADRPEMMLGRMERSGGTYQGDSATLAPLADVPIEQALHNAITNLPSQVMAQTSDDLAESAERFKQMREEVDSSAYDRELGAFFLEGERLLLVDEAPDTGLNRIVELTPSSAWSTSLVPDGNGGYSRTVRIDGKSTVESFATLADIPDRLRLGESRHERLVEMVRMRDLLRRQISLESSSGNVDEMEANRGQLRASYERFISRHGFLNSDANVRLFETDPDSPLLCALEVSYDDGVSAAAAKKQGRPQRPQSATPAPILRERVIAAYESPESADTAKDALVISLAEHGRVDLAYMAELVGRSQDDVIHELHESVEDPLIFRDPQEDQWIAREAYLSGPVKVKLRHAIDAGLSKNIAALEKVQPEDIPASNIGVRLGSVWVPTDVYAAFITHLIGEPAKVLFRAYDANFSVDVSAAANSTAKSRQTWGTSRRPASDIVESLLNSRSLAVHDTVYDEANRPRRVFNEEASAEANAKAREVAAEFEDWVFAEPERRERLARIYNDEYNTLLVRQYDGQHLTFPGKVPDSVIKMRRHQKNGVWRIVQSRNTLLDHAVGAGKTFTIISAAMELRRMRLARKPMIAVPNHMVQQFATDAYRLYPGAKILAAGKKDFERSRRRRLFGRIATGDWDLVIVPHSSFGFIPISKASEIKFVEDEIRQVQQAINDAIEAEGARSRSVKDVERTKVSLEARLERLTDNPKDEMITFEEMGIDHLAIDESHLFKNLWYHTRLTRVLGLGNKEGSKRALDLFMKIQVLQSGTNGRGGLTLMTGTPISNSLVEMYTLKRYLARDQLKAAGIENFDAWHKQFAEARTAMEMTEAGGLEEKTRLAKFTNMPELMAMYYQFADAVTLDDIKLWYSQDNDGARYPVPRIAGGKRRNIVVKPTGEQRRILKEVVSDFEGLKRINNPIERNRQRLRLMDRARKVSLDARAVDKSIREDESGKLGAVVREAMRLYKRWDADRGTQLLFLDRSVPNSKGGQKLLAEFDSLQEKLRTTTNDQTREDIIEKLSRFDMSEIEALRESNGASWNAYDEMKRLFMEQGVPAHQIRYVQEANTDLQKQDLFDGVNAGDIRLFFGSTPRMGAGTNVQQRIVGLHHVDVTFNPSDIEQREGRAERFGNLLQAKYGDDFEVAINAYATERTYDAKMWGLVETKMRFINAIRHYTGEREIEVDDDAADNMAEMAAIASGDPLMLERVRLEAEITKIEGLRRSFTRRQYGIQDQIRSAERDMEAITPERIAQYQADEARAVAGISRMQEHASARTLVVDGEPYGTASTAFDAIERSISAQQGENPKAKYRVLVDGAPLTNRENLTSAVFTRFGDQSPFLAKIGETHYIHRKTAADAALGHFNAMNRSGTGTGERTIGEYLGFPLIAFADARGCGLALSGVATTYSAEARYKDGKVYEADLIRLFNALAIDVQGNASSLQRRRDVALRDLPDLREQALKVFPQELELQVKRNRLTEVTALLAKKTAADLDVEHDVDMASMIEDVWEDSFSPPEFVADDPAPPVIPMPADDAPAPLSSPSADEILAELVGRGEDPDFRRVEEVREMVAKVPVPANLADDVSSLVTEALDKEATPSRPRSQDESPRPRSPKARIEKAAQVPSDGSQAPSPSSSDVVEGPPISVLEARLSSGPNHIDQVHPGVLRSLPSLDPRKHDYLYGMVEAHLDNRQALVAQGFVLGHYNLEVKSFYAAISEGVACAVHEKLLEHMYVRDRTLIGPGDRSQGGRSVMAEIAWCHFMTNVSVEAGFWDAEASKGEISSYLAELCTQSKPQAKPTLSSLARVAAGHKDALSTSAQLIVPASGPDEKRLVSVLAANTAEL